MNILIIFYNNNGLYPIKGNSTRVWCLVQALINQDFNISLLHYKKSNEIEDLNLKNKCNVYYHKSFKLFALKEKFFNDINPFLILKLLKILKNNKFDIIQLEYPFGFISLKFLVKNRAFLIYDAHNVEGEMVDISLKNFNRFPKAFYPIIPIIKKFTKVYEKIVCKFANLIINVSQLDQDYFIKNYKINKNKTVLMQIPSSINNFIELSKNESRKKLGLPLNKTIAIFHGALPHPPNKEAMSLILKKIAPKFRNSNILFVLAGLNLKKFEKNNVISLGFVENLEGLLAAADFAIVPIISGSGQRVKCSDYISAGLPFITTKKGIQGIEFVKNNIDCLIYDSINEHFFEGIKKLYENKNLREELHRNLKDKSFLMGKDYYEKRCNKLYSIIEKKLYPNSNSD